MKTPLDDNLKKVYGTFNRNHDDLRENLMASLPDHSKQYKRAGRISHAWAFTGGTIMKSRITKLAAAAVIIIAIIIGVNQFSGSIDLATIAFADISEAMKNVPWMHSVTRGFDETRKGTVELWIGFETKINAAKDFDGKVIFWNANEYRKYEYDPQSHSITIEYASKDNVPLPMSSPVLFLESMQNTFKEQGAEFTTKSGEYMGQKAQIQEISGSSVGQIKQNYVLRLYIDPESKLLFSAQIKVTDPNGNTIVDGETIFDYPQTGPVDIYDLGVPRDAKIISNLPEEDYLTIWDNYRQSRADAISEYIAVVTHIDRYPVDVIVRVDVDYKSGRKQRCEGHDVFAAGQPYEEFWPEYKEQLGDSFDSLLAWTLKDNEEGKGSLSVYVYDGQYGRNAVRKALGKDAGKWKCYKKHYSPGDPGMPVGSLGTLAWPHIGKSGRIIEDEYATKTDLICIEQLRQGSVDAGSVTLLPTRYLFYLDAHKDYICVRKVAEQCPDAEWQKDKNWLNGVEPEKIRDGSIVVEDITEVIQTADGHWYPKVIVVKQSGIRKDYKEAPLKVTKTKRVYIRTNPEFPKGIFNVEELPGQ